MIILRYFTLVGNLLPDTKIVKTAITLLFITICSFLSAQTSSVEDTKKEANKLFEEEEYTTAYKLFSQLVSNYPKDPELNYKLGVCMIYSEPDKKKCIPFLKIAVSKPEETPKEAKFFLGKAYHINYLFDEAIKYYNEYKKVGSSGNQKKLQVDREIRACGYGKRLLGNLSDLVVLTKKQLNEADYFRSYDLKNIGGKLLVKPDEFKTGPDKRKKDKSIIYLPKNGDRVYFSSYGDNTDNGRDIYYRTKLPNGEYSPAVKVKGINTEFDEDFPFLHPNGTVLYFSSKGHNSMGGYDIFKSEYVKETDSWSPPQNMEFPVNSPDDDYLYVTDSLEKIAYFSTGRQSPPGKIDVLKINTQRKPIDIMALKGSVVKETATQSIKSKITVKNISSGGEIVGIYNSEDNGDYFMELPNGAKLLYTVETPGLKTQSQGVNLPFVTTSKPFKQTISYDNGILKIINYFDEPPSDDSYLQYLSIIESKAKLEVNEGKNNLSPTLSGNNTENISSNNSGTNTAANTNTTSVAGTNTASTSSASNTLTSKANLSTKELSNIAKQDAEESKKEAIQLNQDANDAFEIGNLKKNDADKKLKEAKDAMTNAESLTNEDEKKGALEKANEIKTEAENENALAEKILEYAKTLDEDAKIKIKEAELNKEYAEELDKVIAGKNTSKESLAKLENIQNQLNEFSKQKNKSDEVYNSIKTEIESKEKQITSIETSNTAVKQDLKEIDADIASENEKLTKAKKKEKPTIEEKINQLKIEQAENEKTITDNNSKIESLKNELASLNDELILADKIKNEKIATTINNNAIASNNSINSINKNNEITNANSKSESALSALKEKYKDKIIVSDDTNKESINQSSNELKNFNKEIDAAILKEKSKIALAKTSAEKEKLNSEIKSLEEQKKQNQQQLIANNKLAINVNSSTASNITPGEQQKNQLNPISTNTGSETSAQLEKLNLSLNNNDVQNFDFNAYQNPNAQQLKVQADSKINDASVEQKKLKELIAAAKDAVAKSNQTKTSPAANSGNPAQLLKEGDDLSAKSLEILNLANTKTGNEKEKLINESKELQNKSNEKYLQAAEITKNDNKSVFETNNENIKTLLSENKSNEADNTQAKQLNEEATLAFNQAKSIREEALSQTNIGAKLGGLSNAEEKEADAINKQKQAVDLLKKSNTNVTLKDPLTSSSASNAPANTNSAAENNKSDFTEKISEVNKSIEALSTEKINAYQKLYEANKAELEQISSALALNNSIINSTPAFKTELINGTGKIAAAETLKQNSETAQNNNDKLNFLTTATKKQIDAINLLNKLNKKIEEQVSKNNNLQNNSTVVNSNNSGTNNNSTSANNSNSNSNKNGNSGNGKSNSESGKNTTASNNVGNNTTNPNNQNTNSNLNNNIKNNSGAAVNSNSLAVTPIIAIDALSKTDTTANQTLTYVEKKNIKIKNEQAYATVVSALKELKKTETELKQLENTAVSSASDVSNTNTVSVNELKNKSETVMQSAEELSVKAFDTKQEANTKNGKEKEDLLIKAKEYEDESNSKKIESSELVKQSNEIDYQTNKKAIGELLSKLKNDNPNLFTELEQKNSELAALKNQSNELRIEAAGQPNISAKIGGLGNAEEKEAELLQKQNAILSELKKSYPDYIVKPVALNSTAGDLSSNLTPEEKNKKQLELNEKQNTELTNLTNGYSLEFETLKTSIPSNLTSNQKAVLQNATDLNSESKRLLIKSVQENNPNEKTKLLTLAVKTGNAALEQLNNINGNTSLAANNNPRNNNPRNNNNLVNNTNNANNANTPANNNAQNNNTVRNNNLTNIANNTNNSSNPRNNNTTNNNSGNNNPTRTNNTANNTTNTTQNINNNNTSGRGTIKIEGLEVIAGNAYNATKPIPIDAKMPDGLIFRVQIGAFKTQLPNDAFKGLSPLNGETVGNGFIRYTAGNFNKLENANAVKNDLRNLGYNDAFVVVYYNGKRIPLNEALALLEKEGKTINTNAPQTAGITANSNIPKVNIATPQNQTLNPQDVVTVTKELEQIKNMLFTVQIGVYSKKVTKQQLQNLKPIYTERLANGLFRYTAGIYNNNEKIVADKRKVVDLGIKDAFVSGYLNGKRIDFNEAKNRQLSDSTIKMEAENPIIFADAFAKIENQNSSTTNTIAANNVTTANVQPFKNNVTSYPEATPENGIKPNEEGICFKIQIGAYSKQVPNDVAAKFLSIKNWPVENKEINGLYIYNVGNYSEAKFAKDLKEEVIRLGINDAFISVYRDGKKLFGAEAAGLLNK